MGLEKKRLTILKNHGHRRALVQNSQLALGALLIRGVRKDTSIQQGAVRIRDHGTDITGAVRLAAGVLLALLEAVEVRLDVVLPVERVTLVDRVDAPLLGDGHVGVGKNELADALVEGETVDGAALHGDDQLGRGAVHGEARSDELGAGLEDVLLAARAVLGQLVDGKDGADRHAGVQVGGAVDGVAGDGVARVLGVLEVDDFFLFLGNEKRALARRPHGLDEEVVGDHVQLLLLVARRVGGTGQARQVYQRGAADVVGDGLEGELEGMAEEALGG